MQPIYPTSRSGSSVWKVAGAGVLLSLVLSIWVCYVENQHDQAKFESHARAQALVLDHGLDTAVDVAEDLNHLFTTGRGEVSREQFVRFSRPLRERFPFIEALEFERVLSREERPRLEAAMRRVYPGFFISALVNGKRVPAPAKEKYCFIDYIDFAGEQETPFGFDLFSHDHGLDAIQRATDLAVPSATGLNPYFGVEKDGRTFRILMAVYRNGEKPREILARRSSVIGYTAVVLRPKDLIDHVLDNAQDTLTDTNFRLEIYAGTPAQPANIVYQHTPLLEGPVLVRQLPWLNTSLRPFNHTFRVAGSTWHVLITSLPVPIYIAHGRAIVAFALGLLVTGAIAVYVRSLSWRQRLVEMLVRERTEELRLLNEQLTEDIAARAEVETALRDSQSALRKLAAHQEQVREEERKRIARDIHDDLGQNLMSLRMGVWMIREKIKASIDPEKVTEEALQQIDATIHSVRSIINDLRPAVLDLGLAAALEWQAQEFYRRTQIACHTEIEVIEVELNDDQSTALFRIVQEALTNIAKHAHANCATIKMAFKQGRLILEIIDDGNGLTVQYRGKGHGFGLIGIQERIQHLSGTCSIIAEPGKGTTLSFSLPVNCADESQPAGYVVSK